tara:strand:- start:123 stop:260 length:138 start_codon:yes stop_codon:yes gene_type:complete
MVHAIAPVQRNAIDHGRRVCGVGENNCGIEAEVEQIAAKIPKYCI